jgi:hypothetical protein
MMRNYPIFRLLSTFFLLLALPFVLEAQTANVYGVVSDSVTRQRIPFANVSVVGTMRGAATNNVGFYYVPKLPPGSYEITASVIGYIKVSKRVTLRDGQSVELNFDLPPTTIETQEVLVSAPRKRLEVETTTSVHVLGKQDLKLIPVAAQQDLLQALKILPGIVSTSDVSSKFYVRGGAGDQNLFLYDGIRIYYPFHALGIFSSFNPNVVDNVEVYTGAFPPGLGGRLSSVVSVFTRDGRADRVSARANINFLSTEAEVEGPVFGNSSWLINARKSISSHTFSNIVGQNVPLSFYDATVKLSTQPGGVKKFDVTFISSGDRLNSASRTDPDYAWRNNGVAIAGSSVPTERVFLQWLVFGSVYSAERIAKEGTSITPALTSVKHYGLRTSATVYTSPEDLYYFGFEFGIPSTEYSYVNLLGVRQELKSAFVEPIAWARYQARFGDLVLDGGIHLEVGPLLQEGNVLDEIQPRINVSDILVGTWRGKFSYGRFTQRMLTVGDENDVISIFDPWVRVPENIRSELADHFVLGLSGNLSEMTSVNLETYYKRYGSLVVYNKDKIDASDKDFVQGKGRSYGVELMVRSKVAWLDLYGAYSLSWAIIDNLGFVYYPRYDRRHHLNLLAVGRPAAGLTMTFRWEYGSGFPYSQTIGYFDRLTLEGALPGQFELETGSPFVMLGPKNAARLPAYHRLDANFAYDFSLLGFDCSLGIDLLNVYDNKNIFYFDRKTGQRVDMLSFYPSAALTVRY